MFTVLTWLWPPKYSIEHVVRLRNGVARHLDEPHRFLCVTTAKIAGVETMRPPATPGKNLKCLRRMWMFSPDACRLGHRIFHLDLDVVLMGDIGPLVRRPEPFVIYRCGSIGASGYSLNPSVMLLETGARLDIWHAYSRAPDAYQRAANAAGFYGSDQAVIGYHCRAEDVPTYGPPDGVVSYRSLAHESRDRTPPPGTRIVSLHGRRDPADPAMQARAPWIAEHWR